jgi:putative restriction endonuclease
MFDRPLSSLSDDHRILAAGDRVPDTVTKLILPDGRLRPPEPANAMPHPRFLAWHRNRIFKGC